MIDAYRITRQIGEGQVPKKLNQEDFLKKASEIHGDKYTYERAVYAGYSNLITVTCSKHGNFQITPDSLLSGKGCQQCGRLHGSATKIEAAARKFVEAATKKHNGFYTYEKAVYAAAKKPITVTCPNHGPFEIQACNHLAGRGCPACAQIIRNDSKRMSQEEYLTRVSELHNGRYDYTRTVFTGVADRITVICPEHGEFQQCAANHLAGNGCPRCGKESRAAKQTKSTEEFVAQAREKHQDKYTYENSVYVLAHEKLKVTCPLHGDFEVRAVSHLEGSGCRECAKIPQGEARRITQEQFIGRATEIHNGRYDYSKVEYRLGKYNVTIICSKHGEFEQKAATHLLGNGCRKCGRDVVAEIFRGDLDSFVAKARKAHGDAYDYDRSHYHSSKDKITITCKIHGDFTAFAHNHLRGWGACPRCAEAGTSKQEKEVADFLLEGNPSWISRTRAIIPPNELDLYLDERKLAVEYCGLYWHSEVYKDPSAHQEKLLAAEKAGVRLITVFEDEWVHNKDVVKAVLARVSGASTLRRVGARQCQTVQLSPKDASAFYLAHHLQGPASANLHLGLTLDDELLAAASFSTPRVIFGGQKTPGEIELVRFCQRSDTVIHGALNKLCAAYASYNPEAKHLISYVDRRWFTGSSYLAAGFSQERITPPGYAYVKGQQRYSRYRFAKHRLAEILSVYDPELTERENMANNGYLRIYDCGQIKMKRPLK
jgi:hypothetical protein